MIPNCWLKLRLAVKKSAVFCLSVLKFLKVPLKLLALERNFASLTTFTAKEFLTYIEFSPSLSSSRFLPEEGIFCQAHTVSRRWCHEQFCWFVAQGIKWAGSAPLFSLFSKAPKKQQTVYYIFNLINYLRNFQRWGIQVGLNVYTGILMWMKGSKYPTPAKFALETPLNSFANPNYRPYLLSWKGGWSPVCDHTCYHLKGCHILPVLCLVIWGTGQWLSFI